MPYESACNLLQRPSGRSQGQMAACFKIASSRHWKLLANHTFQTMRLPDSIPWSPEKWQFWGSDGGEHEHALLLFFFFGGGGSICKQRRVLLTYMSAADFLSHLEPLHPEKILNYIYIYTKQMDHSRNMVMRGATRMSLSAHMRAVISKHNNYSLQAIRLIVGMHTQQPDISNSRVMLVHIIMKFLHIFPWLYTPLLGARHCHPSATSHISYCKRPRRHHSSILAFQTASSWAPNNKLVEYHSISPPSLPGKCPNIHWWSLSIDQLSIDDSQLLSLTIVGWLVTIVG